VKHQISEINVRDLAAASQKTHKDVYLRIKDIVRMYEKHPKLLDKLIRSFVK